MFLQQTVADCYSFSEEAGHHGETAAIHNETQMNNMYIVDEKSLFKTIGC